MAFDIFTKNELNVAKRIGLWGFWIVLTVAVLSATIHVIDVFVSEGQDGLVDLVEDNDTLKKDVDAQLKAKDAVPATVTGELPLSLSMPSLGINAVIQSPGPASIDVLDAALKKGPVYYSGSGYPGVRNMLIFGHSTGFSVVNNQAYRVFNNLKNAKAGELVYVRSVSGVSTYRVTSVRKVSKYSTWIDFNSQKAKLTLSTCDSFGKASDRYVVEADYVGFSAQKQ